MAAARRLLGRQLCRVGLHRWGRVREITGLELRGTSPRPDGGMNVDFRTTSSRYAIQCVRPDCRRRRSA
jgi:hypothetical protein